jgi:hypothetical protein
MSAYVGFALIFAVVSIVPAVALYVLAPAANETAWRLIGLAGVIVYVVSMIVVAATRAGWLKAGKVDAS